MTALDTIVAYTYWADTYCPDCIVAQVVSDEHNPRAERANEATHYLATAEENLNRMARALDIDREDERTFDSDDFPKVVFSVQIEEPETCGACWSTIE